MKQKGRSECAPLMYAHPLIWHPDLQTFREALAVLQRQVDDLDELKARHYQEIVEHEEEVWDFVQGKVCLVVRSTLDVFDRLTAKACVVILSPCRIMSNLQSPQVRPSNRAHASNDTRSL